MGLLAPFLSQGEGFVPFKSFPGGMVIDEIDLHYKHTVMVLIAYCERCKVFQCDFFSEC